jgi:cytosine/adenosine deaminase-related metal-dependent hydrolase
MAVVVRGTVAPMAPDADDAVFPGAVWIGDDGRVDAVTRGDGAGPNGFGSAPVVDVGDAVVHPGFVDLHSHVAYNSLPLWTDPGQKTPYLHHDSWPGEPTYGPDISWPSWTLLDRAPETLLAYVQVRALAGGTTAIQGWPGVSRQPTNHLVRSVDNDQIGSLDDPIRVATLTENVAKLTENKRPALLGSGRSFVYHCGEGQPGSLVVRELDDLATVGCLRPGLVAIHCSSLDPARFERWRRAADASDPPPAGAGHPAGTVVWSPLSNLWLYGTTTDVPAARAARLAVCLGTDWGPSGTKNLLGEIKVARIWSDRQGWDLTDHDLVTMITAAPGDALARAWRTPAGRLVEGALGDLTVVARRRDDAWTNLVRSRERDVQLVVVDGRAVYGTRALMTAAGQPAKATAMLRVGTASRRVVLQRPDDPAKTWTWADVLARLDAVRADAAAHPPSGPNALGGLGGRADAEAAAARPEAAGDPPGTPPLRATPDMPGGPAETAGPPPPGRTVEIPPIEPIYHDRKWLDSIEGRGFHHGVLDALPGLFR